MIISENIHVSSVGTFANDYIKVRGGIIREMADIKKALEAVVRNKQTTTIDDDGRVSVSWSPGQGIDKTRTITINIKTIGKEESKIKVAIAKALS
jgi:hypothetical protein